VYPEIRQFGFKIAGLEERGCHSDHLRYPGLERVSPFVSGKQLVDRPGKDGTFRAKDGRKYSLDDTPVARPKDAGRKIIPVSGKQLLENMIAILRPTCAGISRFP
jgi:hypothetical protein